MNYQYTYLKVKNKKLKSPLKKLWMQNSQGGLTKKINLSVSTEFNKSIKIKHQNPLLDRLKVPYVKKEQPLTFKVLIKEVTKIINTLGNSI